MILSATFGTRIAAKGLLAAYEKCRMSLGDGYFVFRFISHPMGILVRNLGGLVKIAYRGTLACLGIVVLVFSLAISSQVSAQIISGDLVGTVLDKTGAVVPGARVEATNSDTGVKYETKANENGEYRFNNLPVGTYSVSASTANFATTTINNFVMELNKTSTLQITLEIKGAVASIEVSGAAPALDTTSAQITTTFDQRLAADLAGFVGPRRCVEPFALERRCGDGRRYRRRNGPFDWWPASTQQQLYDRGCGQQRQDPSPGRSSTFPTTPSRNSRCCRINSHRISDIPRADSSTPLSRVVRTPSTAMPISTRKTGTLTRSTNRPSITDSPKTSDLTTIAWARTFGGPILKNKLFFFGAAGIQPDRSSGDSGIACLLAYRRRLFRVGSATGDFREQPGDSSKVRGRRRAQDTTGTCGPTGDGMETVTSNTGAVATIPEGILSFSGPNYTNNWAGLGASTTTFPATTNCVDAIFTTAPWESTRRSTSGLLSNVPYKFHLVTINEYHTFNSNTQNEFRLGYNRYFNYHAGGQLFRSRVWIAFRTSFSLA